MKINFKSDLLFHLVKRDIADKTAGHLMGDVWTICQPLILMFIYMFLFAFVFPAKTGGGSDGNDFSLNILSGLVPWLIIQDVMFRSVNIFTINATLVKQLIFPIELLPIKTVISTIIIYIPTIIFVVVYSMYKNGLSFTPLLVFIPFLSLIFLCIGIAFFLSTLGVILKDIKDFVSIFCSINLFAMPVLYPPSLNNPYVKAVLDINPLSYVVWEWQSILNNYNDFKADVFIIPTIFCLVVFIFGISVFRKLRYIFGDLI